MKPKLFNFIKFFVGWPISIISIIFLLKFIPSLADSVARLKNVNLPILILSVIFFQLYFLLRGILWTEILKQKKYNLQFRKSLFLWSFSELKRYTPGNIWSFIGRVFLFNKLGVKNKDTIHGLVIESEVIIVSGFLVSLLPLNFIISILPSPFPHLFPVQPLITVFILLLITLFLIGKKTKINSAFPQTSALESLKIIFFCSLSLVFFGLASYFAGASIFYLNPYNITIFVGFFVFALLAGYLSLVTPMGLGVREGVITAGFSKALTLPYAALVAIFTRLVFIVSEAIFILVSYLIYHFEYKKLNKFYSYISNHKEEVILCIFVVSYFIYFTAASFLRYDAFFTGRFDLGNMDQTVWNTIHGRIFDLTNPNGTNTISRLAFHADFILILISPLYWIWDSPKMLLLLQTAIVSAGAVFVYLIAKDILKNKNISLILSLAFLLNPALQNSNLYDFHPVVLATTFLLASFYFLKKKRYLLMIAFLFLSGITKEDIWIITALFGLYIFIFEKKKLLGTIIFLVSSLLFYYLFFIAIPKAAGGQHFALSYYSEFGDSPGLVIKNILTSPQKILQTVTGKGQLTYLKELFAPLGFLPILSPVALIFMSPSFLIDLLSNNSQLHQIYYQYSASITPFLFIGAIYSILFLKGIFPKVPIFFYSIFITVFTLVSAYNFGPMLGSRNPNISMFTENYTSDNLIDKFLQSIPKRYSVSATNEVGSHLSHRQRIYTIPLGIDKADVVVLLKRTSLSSEEIKIIKNVDTKLLSDKNYFIVYRDSKFMVFKKKGLRRSFYYF